MALFMALCAAKPGRAKAKGKCPPLSVALEYHMADRAKARQGGGHLAKDAKR